MFAHFEMEIGWDREFLAVVFNWLKFGGFVGSLKKLKFRSLKWSSELQIRLVTIIVIINYKFVVKIKYNIRMYCTICV